MTKRWHEFALGVSLMLAAECGSSAAGASGRRSGPEVQKTDASAPAASDASDDAGADDE